jgi:hypothetical protein
MDKLMTKHEDSSDGLAEHPIGETISEKKPTQTERKSAFAVLYRLVNASLYRGRTRDSLQGVEFQQVIEQTEEALDAVAQAIHGEPNTWQYMHLCDLCCLRYSEHFAKEQGKELSTWCCTPCYQQLQAEGRRKKEVSHGGQK